MYKRCSFLGYLAILWAIPSFSDATAYTTIDHGSVLDAATWDCNCVPAFTAGNQFSIQHTVTVPSSLINQAAITIEEGGSIEVQSTATFTNSGTLQVFWGDLTINGGGGLVNTLTSTLEIAKNTDGFAASLRLLSGSSTYNLGTLTVSASSAIYAFSSSSFNNSGTLNINGIGASLDLFSTFINAGTLILDNEGTLYGGTVINIGTIGILNGAVDTGTSIIASGEDSVVYGVGFGVSNTNTDLNLDTGAIKPGLDAGAEVGTLTLGNVDLAQGTYYCNIVDPMGFTGGNPFDQVYVGNYFSDSGLLTIDGTAGTGSKLNVHFGYTPPAGSNYDIMYTSGTIMGSFNPGNVTVTGGNVTAWTLSYPEDGEGNFSVRLTVDTVLPVQLTSFTAAPFNQAAELVWVTASEQNLDGFAIEQKLRDGTWKEVGFVKGSGNATTLTTYRFKTKGLTSGWHSFRLKQLDQDGSFTYSPEARVLIELPAAYLTNPVYPNPFQHQAEFEFAVSKPQAVEVGLYNMLGQKVATLFKGTAEAHILHTIPIRGEGLQSGTYLVQLVGNGFAQSQKLTLIKP